MIYFEILSKSIIKPLIFLCST